ncbi:MAG: sigma-54-dependent Fis family transcriptional regulator [Sphingobium sp.]|nr:MAG: sigma-54-dependent Fis family transcriptional regulator [Sphingobium sp.]
MALDILIVDDEEDIRDLVAGVLEDEGFTTRTGLELLDEIKRRDATVPVLMISGHGNIDTAVAAIRKGAADFIEKPFEADRLLHLVARATETERLRRENQTLRARFGQDDELTGTSASINGVRATIKKVAFIIVAAARMDPDRVEEELFGVEDPSGLVRPGYLEQAHGGTLYLDEIADMPVTTQGKILRVLTDQSFTRVGGQRQVKVDVRVISSTARNLTAEIEERRFREDLFYRLNVVPLQIPSLSERRDDIPPLVEHYLARFAADRRVNPPEIASDAMAALQANEWPGNVRQLRNVIERTMILAPGDRIGRIELDMLPAELTSGGGGDGIGQSAIMGAPLREARESFEREYLRIQIRRFSGNISRTATFIGMERSALHRKLKLLGITDGKDG